MTDLHMRTARKGDREAIRELTMAAYQEYADVSPQHWEGYRQNIVKTLTETAMDEWIVAERAGAIAGAVLLCPAGSLRPSAKDGEMVPRQWSEIRLLGVAPARRGQGVGRALTEECIRRVRAAGDAIITLHTTDLMQTAMGMYERMGFVRFPETDFFPPSGLIVKGYRLELRPPAPRQACS